MYNAYLTGDDNHLYHLECPKFELQNKVYCTLIYESSDVTSYSSSPEHYAVHRFLF